MPRAITDDQKLALLAGFDEGHIGTGGRKLTIHADGSYECISGLVGNIFRRSSADSLTEQTKYTAVKDLFLREIRALPAAPDAARVGRLCAAFRGYSRLVKRGYADRINANDGFKNSYKDIESQLIAALQGYMKAPDQGNGGMVLQYVNNQSTFIDDSQILDKGACFGIATKWAARWVLDGKVSYAISGQGQTVLVDQRNLGRIHRKSPEIYALQKKQHALRAGGNVGQIISAPFVAQPAAPINIFAPILALQNTQNAQAINTNLDTLYKNRPAGSAQSVQQATVRQHLDVKAIKYDLLQTTARRDFQAERFFSCNWNDNVVRRTFDSIFAYINASAGNGRSAFLVSWSAREPEQSRYNGEGGGHAMACFKYDLQRWFFMDPNFGEWGGTETQIKEIMGKVASYYSASHELSQWYVVKVYMP